jgi:hypothetical protein
MALQTINVGQYVNDGTGDDLRTAFLKINANFDELDLQGGQANTIHNVGTGIGLYKEKIGVDLRLKTLIAGPGITITQGVNEVTINNVANKFVTFNANTGNLTASSTSQAVNILGANGISTSIVGNTLTITGSTDQLINDLSPQLGGDLDLNENNIIGGTGTIITASNFYGTFNGNLVGTVYGLDVRNINDAISFDFGSINFQLTSPIQYFLAITDIDMGSFSSPNQLGMDLGTFI